MEAPTPPEVLFHRYFQNPARHPDDRRAYRGKQDLAALPAALAAFLSDVQNALNEALSNEKQNVPEHVEHPPFHLDYIDSVVSNALAFRVPEYSFIGITMPLINTLWHACVELSKSNAVGALLEVADTPEREEAILTVLFQTQLIFVVTHEYTHHVHGHFSQHAPGSAFFDEIASGGVGNLEEQAFELDADGYAVYHALAHLITGPRREQATEILSCKHAQPSVQDEILLSSFVMAVGAFLYVLPPVSVDPCEIYSRSHPLQAARMRWVMNNTINWCKQNDRPALAAYMTVARFQTLMLVIATAISRINGERDWSEQTAFLKSKAGSSYLNQLTLLVRSHIQAL
jgi:hypothetical protein